MTTVQFKTPRTTGGADAAPTYAELQQQVAELQKRILSIQDTHQAGAKYVLEAFSESQDQHYALALAITDKLTPTDPSDPPDDWPLTAWRLAQVLERRLESTADMKIARSFLLGAQE